MTLEEVDLFVPQGYVPATFFCRKTKKNGGAGIFIKNHIKFVNVNLSNFVVELDCEMCCVKLLDHNINVVSLYRAPQGNVSVFFKNFELAIKYLMKVETRVAICGDFNLEMVTMATRNSILFSNLLRSLNLVCTIKTPTRINSCIDNILVNFSEDHYKVNAIEGQFADHQSNFIQVFSKFKKSSNQSKLLKEKVQFRKQTDNLISNFKDLLEKESWLMIQDFNSGEIGVESLFDNFYKQYIHLWHFVSPLISKSKTSKGSKSKKLQWYTDELANLRRNMLDLFHIYKNLRNSKSDQTKQAYTVYLASKRRYRVQLTQAKRQACERYIQTSANRCKAAWNIISQESSPTSTHDVTLDPEEVNSYFLNSVLDLSNNISSNGTSFADLLGDRLVPPETFYWQRIEPADIARVVSKLSNSKSMDFYWLSNNIVKKTIHYIKEPFAFIINQCLEHGYFSDLLKLSKVIPVYKKGDKSQPQNYRPISLVPVFSKIIESILLEQLSSYFNNFNLISDSQFGFRAGRSTTTAVTTIIDHTLSAFEDKKSVALSLLDLSKAFDCVPFIAIMEKLKFYGVSELACRIIMSYLSNRKQYVSIKGSNSSVKIVSIGVPQGSILGPFFFSIIINDLPKNLNVSSAIYADDTSLFSSHKNLTELQGVIKAAQVDAGNWFSSNKLHCNQDKTQNIILSLSHNQHSTAVKLLGFTIDSKLTWNNHVDSVCKKISRVSYLIWKLRDFISIEYLRTAYFGIFQSHISYGLILWGHASSVSRILVLQKSVVRTLCHAGPLDHCRPLFVRMKILTVVNLYIYHILIFSKTHLNSFSTRQEIHNYPTRNRLLLDTPQHRLSKTGSSHKTYCIKFFNKLHISAHSASLNNFKSKLIYWLHNHPFYTIQEFLETDIDVIF